MKLKTSRLGIVMIIGFCILAVGIIMPVNAADNITDTTNVTDDSLIDYNETVENITPLYVNTAEYQTSYNYWIDYYRNQSQPSKEQIREYLLDETQNSETRFNNVLSYIGRNDILLTFLDTSKRTIDDYTGNITYDLGVVNWWANIFGVGISESDLPQNIANGNALYDVYKERYNLISEVEMEIYNE